MIEQLNDVREFMRTFGQETPEAPTVPAFQTIELRWNLSKEENDEMLAANDRISLFDALEDRLYVALGDLIAFGCNDIEQRAAIVFQEREPTKNLFLSMSLAEYVLETGKRTPLDKIIAHAVFRDTNQQLLTLNTADQLIDIALEKTLIAFADFPVLGFTREQLFAGFKEVHRSNMSKLWSAQEMEDGPEDVTFQAVGEGKFIAKNTSGKVIKSPSYGAPNFAPILGL